MNTDEAKVMNPRRRPVKVTVVGWLAILGSFVGLITIAFVAWKNPYAAWTLWPNWGVALPGLIAGWGILKGRSWCRWLLLVCGPSVVGLRTVLGLAQWETPDIVRLGLSFGILVFVGFLLFSVSADNFFQSQADGLKNSPRRSSFNIALFMPFTLGWLFVGGAIFVKSDQANVESDRTQVLRIVGPSESLVMAAKERLHYLLSNDSNIVAEESLEDYFENTLSVELDREKLALFGAKADEVLGQIHSALESKKVDSPSDSQKSLRINSVDGIGAIPVTINGQVVPFQEIGYLRPVTTLKEPLEKQGTDLIIDTNVKVSAEVPKDLVRTTLLDLKQSVVEGFEEVRVEIHDWKPNSD
jgi:hypothetical protein